MGKLRDKLTDGKIYFETLVPLVTGIASIAITIIVAVFAHNMTFQQVQMMEKQMIPLFTLTKDEFPITQVKRIQTGEANGKPLYNSYTQIVAYGNNYRIVNTGGDVLKPTLTVKDYIMFSKTPNKYFLIVPVSGCFVNTLDYDYSTRMFSFSDNAIQYTLANISSALDRELANRGYSITTSVVRLIDVSCIGYNGVEAFFDLGNKYKPSDFNDVLAYQDREKAHPVSFDVKSIIGESSFSELLDEISWQF